MGGGYRSWQSSIRQAEEETPMRTHVLIALGCLFILAASSTVDTYSQITCGLDCGGGSCGCSACVSSGVGCWSCRHDACSGATDCDVNHALCLCSTAGYAPCGRQSFYLSPTLEPIVVALHQPCGEGSTRGLLQFPLSRGAEAPFFD